MEVTSTVLIKMFDGMVRELKEVRYVPQLKKNLISVAALEVLGLEVFIRDGILKMTRDSMGFLKSVRRINIYHLKSSMVTGQVAISIDSNNDCTRL